jgi:hypothetical protein
VTAAVAYQAQDLVAPRRPPHGDPYLDRRQVADLDAEDLLAARRTCREEQERERQGA